MTIKQTIKTTMIVNDLGKIDVYQYIYFLCQHAKRHIKQMQGVKEEFSRLKEADGLERTTYEL